MKNKKKKWCPGADSNHRHADFQSRGLSGKSILWLETACKTATEIIQEIPDPVKLVSLIIAIGLAGRALNPVFVNDQLELLEFSARWQWAYDEQMPVYAWISTALLRLTGDSVLALDALKYLWVGGMLMALAGIAERLRPGSGVIAIAFAFLLPTVNDDLMGEVSHTASMMCAAAVSAWLIVRAMDGEMRRLWLWLGLVWTGGLMAKHSMVPVVLAEIAAVAALCGPGRARMLRNMVSAAGIMAALCAPLYALLAMAPETVGEQLGEFYADRGLGAALMDCLSSPFAEGGLLIVGIGIAVAWKHGAMGRTQIALVAVAAGFVGLVIAGVLLSGATVLRDRWLAAGLVLLAPVGASMVPRPARWTVAAGAFVLIAAGLRAAETAGLMT